VLGEPFVNFAVDLLGFAKMWCSYNILAPQNRSIGEWKHGGKKEFLFMFHCRKSTKREPILVRG
jgi:hypothetical protein